MTPFSADAAGSPGGLVAVHAHPDDETLATGALLANWAAAGRPVTVVTCTRGELGEVIGPTLAHLEGDGPALAAHRELELAGALRALGVRDHVFLDQLDPALADGGPAGPRRFSDSGMAWAGAGHAGRLDELPDGAFVAVPLDGPALALARLLRARRPEVVVTYEPGGGYGHPDHVRAHDVTMLALALAADGGLVLGGAPAYAPAAVLWCAVAAGALRAAYQELRARELTAPIAGAEPPVGSLALPDPVGPLPSVAVADAAIDVEVDVTSVLDAVAAALAAHATQVHAIAIDPDPDPDPDRAAAGAGVAGAGVVGCYALSNDVLAPLLSRESYRFAPGQRRSPVRWPAGVRPVA
ncbi:PIG-L family deacetylase [Pengzhenrongella sicca]|uniref:PIG-L family deacetylase n=1 Tax=Pengzhenrongella sicca TaxID=2819238 RepID=A0A8A4ZA76_9MICO|nr:PIG-L family deacetylase [Pengzhenrongella sicca]QTE28822.1 PIG-L family deacetylase [Pengzhenrongella sicca]